LAKGRSLKIVLAVFWALVVLFLLGFGFRLLRGFVPAPPQTSVSPPVPPSIRTAESEVTLYFADGDAGTLAPEKRYARMGGGKSADAASIIAELIKGPKSQSLYATIPPETRLIDAFELGDTLVLDFTHELQTNNPGGSTDELLTIYSIVNTLTENLPGVKNVQILLEGAEVDTLTGHMDLSRPLTPDTKWMKAWLPSESGA
jgi:spore germination protein GerM